MSRPTDSSLKQTWASLGLKQAGSVGWSLLKKKLDQKMEKVGLIVNYAVVRIFRRILIKWKNAKRKGQLEQKEIWGSDFNASADTRVFGVHNKCAKTRKRSGKKRRTLRSGSIDASKTPASGYEEWTRNSATKWNVAEIDEKRFCVVEIWRRVSICQPAVCKKSSWADTNWSVCCSQRMLAARLVVKLNNEPPLQVPRSAPIWLIHLVGQSS
jgi:hypothetical protein